MARIPFVVTNEGLSVFLNKGDKHHSIDTKHPNYTKALALLKEQNNREVTEDELENLLSLPKYVESWTEGEIYVKGGRIYVKDFGFSQAVSDKVLLMMAQDVSPTPLMLLLQRVRQNPDQGVWEQLVKFLIANGFLIDEKGFIIGYRRVTSNFLDFYSKKFDNSPGAFVQMDRSKVVRDPNRACAPGLHIGALQYARQSYYSGQGKLIACRIDPKDVVSVPHDYNSQKMRVCAYFVIGELLNIEKGLSTDAAVLTIAHFKEAVKNPVLQPKNLVDVMGDHEDVDEDEDAKQEVTYRGDLTGLDKRIIRLHNDGKSRREIAEALKITEYRVRKALAQIGAATL